MVLLLLKIELIRESSSSQQKMMILVAVSMEYSRYPYFLPQHLVCDADDYEVAPSHSIVVLVSSRMMRQRRD